MFGLIKYKTVEDCRKSMDFDFGGECHVLSSLHDGN